MDEINEITIDEWIWVLFIALSIANIFGDELERKSILEGKKGNKNAKKIFITTAAISIIVYIYFVFDTYDEIKEAKEKNKDVNLYELKLLGNVFIVVGAILLIYFSINETDFITPELP